VAELGCVPQSLMDLKLCQSKGSLSNVPKEKDVWHAYRVTGALITVVWMQWSLESPGFVSAGANWDVAVCRGV